MAKDSSMSEGKDYTSISASAYQKYANEYMTGTYPGKRFEIGLNQPFIHKSWKSFLTTEQKIQSSGLYQEAFSITYKDLIDTIESKITEVREAQPWTDDKRYKEEVIPAIMDMGYVSNSIEKSVQTYGQKLRGLRFGLSNLNKEWQEVFSGGKAVTNKVERLRKHSEFLKQYLNACEKFSEDAFANIAKIPKDEKSNYAYAEYAFRNNPGVLNSFLKMKKLVETIDSSSDDALISLTDDNGAVNGSGFWKDNKGQLLNAKKEKVNVRALEPTNSKTMGGFDNRAHGIIGELFESIVSAAILSQMQKLGKDLDKLPDDIIQQVGALLQNKTDVGFDMKKIFDVLGDKIDENVKSIFKVYENGKVAVDGIMIGTTEKSTRVSWEKDEDGKRTGKHTTQYKVHNGTINSFLNLSRINKVNDVLVGMAQYWLINAAANRESKNFSESNYFKLGSEKDNVSKKMNLEKENLALHYMVAQNIENLMFKTPTEELGAYTFITPDTIYTASEMLEWQMLGLQDKKDRQGMNAHVEIILGDTSVKLSNKEFLTEKGYNSVLKKLTGTSMTIAYRIGHSIVNLSFDGRFN